MLLHSPQKSTNFKAPYFNLFDPNGVAYSLADFKTDKGVVIAFICNHCPYVKAIITRMVHDFKKLQDAGFSIIAINPNDYSKYPEDSPEKMIAFANHHGFSFPYLIDENQSVAKAYGAVCTPDFFGFDKDLKLKYRGRLDDAKMGDASNRTTELMIAMQHIANTGEQQHTQHPSMGCSIKWK